MTKRRKEHDIVIKVRFDKDCTRGTAIKALRDCIHGEFYTTPRDDRDPETFKVKGYRHPREAI